MHSVQLTHLAKQTLTGAPYMHCIPIACFQPHIRWYSQLHANDCKISNIKDPVEVLSKVHLDPVTLGMYLEPNSS